MIAFPVLVHFSFWRNGGLVYENYFHDADSTTEFDIKSVTKSVVSALAGIAQAKGLLSDLNTPVVKLFPEFAQPPNFPLQCTYTRFHHDEYNIVQV